MLDPVGDTVEETAIETMKWAEVYLGHLQRSEDDDPRENCLLHVLRCLVPAILVAGYYTSGDSRLAQSLLPMLLPMRQGTTKTTIGSRHTPYCHQPFTVDQVQQPAPPTRTTSARTGPQWPTWTRTTTTAPSAGSGCSDGRDTQSFHGPTTHLTSRSWRTSS